ncbi:hypothetical protein H310_03009 [Aphanomyces invadans]|uniref:Ras-GEF domain-containing protein n=2 Tax=Aphanomyces invadans TaxID=157072 RepID=A0A024UKR5_9STRA|nr:hypothetical protein H310_03009 [Aphanomyces invadans]ETW06884.1 hypothetical protein H310_03009 [Aphanomyces invadans]|eukprot:XP_008864959.1 hypothetical protein H310_03009 [Aphanomyces invadans]
MMELKRGILSVHGTFLWRERDVVVTQGQVAIYRRTRGTLKTKINLWDPHVYIAFAANETTLTITCHHDDEVILDCRTPAERDAWLAVLYAAQANAPTVMSSTSQSADDDSDTDSDFETSGGSDDSTTEGTLAAFQNVRSSIIFDVGQLTRDEINRVLLPTTQSLDAAATSPVPIPSSSTPQTCSSSSKHLVALATYIERTENGGRIVLLHWDVIVELGLGMTLPALLMLLSDRQGTRVPTSSCAPAAHRKPSLTHKTNVSSFVRDLLFHPLYSQRLRSCEAACLAVIDSRFPHCRLRRFSNTDDDLPSTFKSSSSSTAITSQTIPLLVRKHSVPQTSSSSMSLSSDWSTEVKKRNSFPSIVMSGISLAQLQPSTVTNSFATVPPLRTVMATYKLTPLMFAQQCTLFHHGQLTALPLWSFLSPGHFQKDISDSFNRLTAYLVWSILVEDSPTDRADAIDAVTAVAMASSAKFVNNFHLVMACIGCLGDTPLMQSRLPLTWKRVKSKTKAHLYELRSLCDYTGGFDTLRRKQSLISATCPSLPFLGIVGAALERLKSSPYLVFNATASESSGSEPPSEGHLDMERLERQYNTLHVVENAMTTQYPLIGQSDVQHLLGTLPKQLQFVTPKLLHMRSLQLQHSETQSLRSSAAVLFSSNPSGSSVSDGTGGNAATATGAMRRVSMTTESGRVLSFRASCVLWHCVAKPEDRLRMLVEALFADDKSTPARLAATLHRDVRTCVFTASSAAMCLQVTQGLDAIFRTVVDTSGGECVEVTGWEDPKDWQPKLYECLVDVVFASMAQIVQAKLQAEYKEQDGQLRRRLQNQTDTLVHYTMFNPLNQLVLQGQTPVALLRLLSSVVQELNSTDAIARKQLRTLLANSTSTTPQSAIEFVSSTIDLTKCSTDLVRGIDLLKKAVQLP